MYYVCMTHCVLVVILAVFVVKSFDDRPAVFLFRRLNYCNLASLQLNYAQTTLVYICLVVDTEKVKENLQESVNLYKLFTKVSYRSICVCLCVFV